MSVCLSEERRRAVLLRLSPAFEDLFDPAEEHALNVLLEPWTLLSQTLRDALHTVRYISFFSSVLCFISFCSQWTFCNVFYHIRNVRYCLPGYFFFQLRVYITQTSFHTVVTTVCENHLSQCWLCDVVTWPHFNSTVSVGGAVGGGAIRRGRALPDTADSLHTHTEPTAAGDSPSHIWYCFESCDLCVQCTLCSVLHET